MNELLSKVKFNDQGLVCCVAQDFFDNKVLMVAWMNEDTLKETLETNKMVYYSRSRQSRWLKGETSGHFQKVREVYIDCDGDTLVFKIEQSGAACHENYRTCFFRKLENDKLTIVETKLID